MMEAVSSSETAVSIYQIIWRNILEDSHLHTRHRENLKSHLVNQVIYLQVLELMAARLSEVPNHRPDKKVLYHKKATSYIALSLKRF
jgi:hypothetical protein